MKRNVGLRAASVMFIITLLFSWGFYSLNFFSDTAAAQALIFGLIGMGILIGISRCFLERKFVDCGMWLIVLGFALRMFWVIYAYESSMLTLGVGTYRLGDVNLYDRSAWGLANSAWDYKALVKYCFIPNPGYIYFLGVLYRIFGHSTPLAAGLNSFIGCIIGVIMYRLAHRAYHNEFVARMTYILCLFFPPLIYYQGLLFKDTFLVFSVVLIAWGMSRFLSTSSISVLRNRRPITIIVLSMIALYTLRYQIFFPVLAVVGWVLMKYKLRTLKQRIGFLIIVFILLFFIVGFLQSAFLWKDPVATVEELFENTGNVEEYVKEHPESFFRFASGGLLRRWHLIPVAFSFALLQPFPQFASRRWYCPGCFNRARNFNSGPLDWRLYPRQVDWLGHRASFRES